MTVITRRTCRPCSSNSCVLQRMLLTIQAQSDDFPHLLFYGPSGAGKKTRVLALLKELFGDKVDKVKAEQRSFDVSKTNPVSVTIVSSQFHIEMSPSECGHVSWNGSCQTYTS